MPESPNGPAAPGAPPTLTRPRLGDLLLVLGALMVLGFSFAPFVQYDKRGDAAFFAALLDVSPWFNAWALTTFMVPLTTFVIMAALLAAAAVVTRLALRRDPGLLGFRLPQLEVGLTLFTFTVLVGMLASDKQAIFGARRFTDADESFAAVGAGLDTGWGAVLMLLGATLALAGAILNHTGVGPILRSGKGLKQRGAPPLTIDSVPGGGGRPDDRS